MSYLEMVLLILYWSESSRLSFFDFLVYLQPLISFRPQFYNDCCSGVVCIVVMSSKSKELCQRQSLYMDINTQVQEEWLFLLLWTVEKKPFCYHYITSPFSVIDHERLCLHFSISCLLKLICSPNCKSEMVQSFDKLQSNENLIYIISSLF